MYAYFCTDMRVYFFVRWRCIMAKRGNSGFQRRKIYHPSGELCRRCSTYPRELRRVRKIEASEKAKAYEIRYYE